LVVELFLHFLHLVRYFTTVGYISLKASEEAVHYSKDHESQKGPLHRIIPPVIVRMIE
jgi:hypothetical protein